MRVVITRPYSDTTLQLRTVQKGEVLEVSEKRAKLLISRGVAEIAKDDKPTAEKPKETPKEDKPTEHKSNAGASLTLGAMSRMNKSALESLAKRHNVDLSGANNNKERAELIFSAINRG